MSRTQIMRLAHPTILALRNTRTSWCWIAARVERVRAKGIEVPIPSEAEVDAAFTGQSLGPVRAAYVRVVREIEARIKEMEGHTGQGQKSENWSMVQERASRETLGNLPMIRAGPDHLAEKPSTPSTSFANDAVLDDAPKVFFDKLAKLRKPS